VGASWAKGEVCTPCSLATHPVVCLGWWLVVGGWWTKICVASGVIRRVEGTRGSEVKGRRVCATLLPSLLCCNFQNVSDTVDFWVACIIIALGCPRMLGTFPALRTSSVL
jgi:hypothetical protein